MRKEFVETKSRRVALMRCRWATAITKVEGGYMCFESEDDYELWKSQR